MHQNPHTIADDKKRRTMTARDLPEEAPAVVLAPPQPTSEEPYSIFDKRQKALIILIISTAATCEYRITGTSVFLGSSYGQ